MLRKRNRVVAPSQLSCDASLKEVTIGEDALSFLSDQVPKKRRSTIKVHIGHKNDDDLPQKNGRNVARGSWSMKVMEEAIDAVDDGLMSIRQAAIHFGIPQTTLRNHLYGLSQHKFGTIPRALTVDEEKYLLDYVLGQRDKGMVITLEMLRDKVAEMVINRETCFKDGLPGAKWWRGFKKRHPEIKSRSAQCVELSRIKSLTTGNLQNFYGTLGNIYASLQLDPARVWTCHETGLQAGATTGIRLLCRSSNKSLSEPVPNCREWVTILCCVSAAGYRIPNLYIFKGKRMKDNNILAGCEPGAICSYKQSAWINDALFLGWLDHFKESVPGGISSSRPHLLVCDSYGSHVTIEVITKAKEMGLHIIQLPPHTSHKLQPLHVACFSPFKHWFRKLRARHVHDKGLVEATKQDVAALCYKAFDFGVSASNIKAGFEKTGIWPLNNRAVQPDVSADETARNITGQQEDENNNDNNEGGGGEREEECQIFQNAQHCSEQDHSRYAAVTPFSKQSACNADCNLHTLAVIAGQGTNNSVCEETVKKAEFCEPKRCKLPPIIKNSLYITSDQFLQAKIDYQQQLDEAKKIREQKVEENRKKREERAALKEQERIQKENVRKEREEKQKAREAEIGARKRKGKRKIIEEDSCEDEEVGCIHKANGDVRHIKSSSRKRKLIWKIDLNQSVEDSNSADVGNANNDLDFDIADVNVYEHNCKGMQVESSYTCVDRTQSSPSTKKSNFKRMNTSDVDAESQDHDAEDELIGCSESSQSEYLVKRTRALDEVYRQVAEDYLQKLGLWPAIVKYVANHSKTF